MCALVLLLYEEKRHSLQHAIFFLPMLMTTTLGPTLHLMWPMTILVIELLLRLSLLALMTIQDIEPKMLGKVPSRRGAFLTGDPGAKPAWVHRRTWWCWWEMKK
jgi:hypothetical protein